ncbi:MAG TPA: hypothetical protein VFL83_14790 [Anaeromyxobacter sp.]|nr:hypothetical protein [Anaeromyxobacter sp.]
MRIHRYLCALAAALLASCADYSVPDNVLYGEAVYTQPDPAFTGFKALDFYWLDTAVKVYEDDPDNPTLDDLTDYPGIVSAIDANMEALGYTKLGAGPPIDPAFPSDGTAATAVLRVAVSKGTGEYWYGGYWCDPYYYYWCYYDWYYAGSYKFGTVMMSLNDFSVTAGPGTTLPIRWIAAMYGVATTVGYDVQRIAGAIDVAFGQSQYLDTH